MGQDQQIENGGYAPGFLGKRLEAPELDAALEDDAVQLDGSAVIPYTHFSLVLSKSRGFARWVAWNIDGGSIKRINRQGIPFVKDSRLPAQFQNGDELYGGNRLDRGHIARRADLLWGSLPEAASANRDSFFFTNISPQMDDFNQSSKNGVWGRLEEAVFDDVDVQDLKVTAFGGPVFQDNDREYRGVRIPREFWKLLAYVEQGELKSSAFLLTQNINPFEALDLDEFRAFQVGTDELEQRTGLRFADALRGNDNRNRPGLDGADRAPLEGLSDIRW
jgi:endonuclease G